MEARRLRARCSRRPSEDLAQGRITAIVGEGGEPGNVSPDRGWPLCRGELRDAMRAVLASWHLVFGLPVAQLICHSYPGHSRRYIELLARNFRYLVSRAFQRNKVLFCVSRFFLFCSFSVFPAS